MSPAHRVLVPGVALAAAALAFAASPAAADGPCTASADHVSCTILRPLAPPQREAPLDAPECVVAVGGLGSDNNDLDRGRERDTFGDLLATFAGDPRYRIHRFGSLAEDPTEFGYDTYGSLGVSGIHFRDYVRSLSGTCYSIHVVAHSMGGDVADRAFAMGLSSRDGVETYLPISTPHNGAMVARFAAKYINEDQYFAEAVHEITSALHEVFPQQVHDPTTAAVRDLARVRPPLRQPRGVVELRQRLASDEFVFLPDNWDWRYEGRDRLPDPHLNELEGHGGSLKNAEIRSTVANVIRTRAIPPDDRSDLDKALGLIMSIAFLVVALCVGFYAGKVLERGIELSQKITGPLAIAMPFISDAVVALVRAGAFVLDAGRRALSILRSGLDLFDDVEEVAGRLLHVARDARVAMVRQVLDAATRAIEPR